LDSFSNIIILGLIARVIEAQGIATVTLNMFPEVADYVKVPRTVITEFPFGSPDNRDMHLNVLKECLKV